MSIKVGVPREVLPGERRVALVPATVALLLQAGAEVLIERDAGASAFIPDDAYREAGASVVEDAASLWGEADVVLKVQKPAVGGADSQDETALLRSGATVIGLLQPLTSTDLVKTLAERGVTSFSMDAIPRIARAQKMDALTSMATIAGYKSVLIASGSLGKLFPMMMTAAQTIPPAKGRGAGGRRCRPPGHCHRPPTGRHNAGLRCPPGGQGAGGEPGRRLRGGGGPG